METKVKFDIKELNWPERKFIIQRMKLPIDKLPEFFSKSYGEIYGALQRFGIQPKEPPCAIYYSIDELMKETDLAAAVPVQGNIPMIEELKTEVIPPSKVLAATYYGSYENMSPVYAELEKYMAEHGLKRKLIMEEYFSDPAVEKDPAKWKTNIYFVLQ